MDSCIKVHFTLLLGLLLPADPVAQVHQAFCKNLLERAVESLVKPPAKKKAGDQEEESW